MDLIERYVHAVGLYLPGKQQKDIEAELRSLLEDALEDRVEGEPTEDDVVALLEEYGPPQKVAASYWPEGQVLIGPRLYPTFRLAVGIALLATVIVHLVLAALAVFTGEPASLAEVASGIFDSLMSALGVIVVVFYILHHMEVRLPRLDDGWDPRKLEPVEEVEPVKGVGTLVGLVFDIVLLLVLNLLPDRLGFVRYIGAAPFVDPVLPGYRVWLSLLLLVDVALRAVLLLQRRWQTGTRVFKLVTNVANLVVLYLVIMGYRAWLVANPDAEFYARMGMVAMTAVFGGVAIGFVVDTVEIGYRLARPGLRRLGIAG
jgi:hypothetical protein